MKHKFAYLALFWLSIHLTFATTFLVRRLVIGGELMLIGLWLVSVVLDSAILIFAGPALFREIVEESP